VAIVVSHLGSDFDQLVRGALRQIELADLVELRLDRCGSPGASKLRDFVQAAGKPVIAAVKGREQGGDFAGGRSERFAILEQAAGAGCAFVDVDWSEALELGPLSNPRCHRIVSRHDRSGTPPDLARFEEEVREVLGEGDAIKLVTQAHTSLDGLRVLRHLRGARGGLIAFAAGEAGTFTRLLAPIFGSAFTYAAPAIVPGEAPAPLSGAGQLRVNDLRGLLPPGGVHPGTSVFAVVGSRVRHSFSPHVHGMALKMAQLDALFLALETDDLASLLELLDDPCFRGLAITAPHKAAACRLAAAREPTCAVLGAANTLVREGARWRAFNTDVTAVKEVLARVWPFHRQRQGQAYLPQEPPLVGVSALVLGAGGAARAAVLALRELGAQVHVAARRAEAAAELARELGVRALEWTGAKDLPWEVLVNATSVGALQASGPSPVPVEWIRPKTLVLDAVYAPLKTELLAAATRAGCTAVPGAEWFVRQAAAQFQHFTRTAASEPVLRAAFEHALKTSSF
jgi:3-dehydroquinate dehydratase/shikimate dehydrogenase